MNLDNLATRLTALGLPKVDEVLALAKPATHLKPSGRTDPESRTTRIGGRPLLPPGAPWPRKDDTPLSLVAQIRLDELPGATTVLGLPATGLLSFFYDMGGQPWGFDPADRGSFAVIHTEDPDSCTAAEFPRDLAPDFRIPPTALTAEPISTLPSPLARAFPTSLFTDEEYNTWTEALFDLTEELGWTDRTILGGHPIVIQNDMTLECEMVGGAGVYVGNAGGYDDPRLPEWEKDAGQWTLLLQVASEEATGLMWGDMGCLYYWIRKGDLEMGRFDRAWQILQCF